MGSKPTYSPQAKPQMATAWIIQKEASGHTLVVHPTLHAAGWSHPINWPPLLNWAQGLSGNLFERVGTITGLKPRQYSDVWVGTPSKNRASLTSLIWVFNMHACTQAVSCLDRQSISDQFFVVHELTFLLTWQFFKCFLRELGSV